MSSLLGISISTVSRALKDHPDISNTTKQKVRELAEMMEYQPNAHAINLRTSKSNVFGLIVPEISTFFYDDLIGSLEKEAKKHGYSLMTLQSNDSAETEAENLRFCKQSMVAGIFVSVSKQTKDISAFMKLEEQGIPVIFLDKVPAFEACNKICMDDVKAAQLAAEALVAANKKNILAIFGSKELSITAQRLQAFENYFEGRKGEKIKLTVLEAGNTLQAYEASFEELNSGQKYDALFCMSDEILTGVMKSVQRLQLNYPRDIGIIAISNGTMPHYYFPEITYVETSGSKLGKLAYDRMKASLIDSSFIQNLKVEASLKKRDSL